MSTDAISPLRQRMIEDMSGASSTRTAPKPTVSVEPFVLSIIVVGYIGWGTWIRTRINEVRVLAASSCLPRRVKPGAVLLREYHGERLTVTVVPTGYLWRETAYASLLQWSGCSQSSLPKSIKDGSPTESY